MTAGPRLSVDSLRLLPGCAAGLAEPTALVGIAVSGVQSFGTEFESRLKSGALGLCPGEQLFGVSDADWPQGFLVETQGDPVSGEQQRLGEWIAAVAVALQRWAGDPVWRGRVLTAEPDRITLAIPWFREALATDAVSLTLRLVTGWLRSESTPVQSQLESARQATVLSSTRRFLQAAVTRGMPTMVLEHCIQLGWGCKAFRMDGSFTDRTSVIASGLARDKLKSKLMLASAGVPIALGGTVATIDEARQVAAILGWPVVIKPSNQDDRVGVVSGIVDGETLSRAFERANEYSPGTVIIEQHIPGDDFRLLVVGGTLLSAIRRLPGGIVGDGVRTVRELLEALNADPRRGDGSYSTLFRFPLDDEALRSLSGQGLTDASVPEAGRFVALREAADVGTGGTTEALDDVVHPDNRLLAERAARVFNLDVAGVDVITTDISRSWREGALVISELNAKPQFRPHWTAEPDRDINRDVIDLLVGDSDGRIPTAAVIGDDSAATISLLLHAIWRATGVVAAVSCISETRIGEESVDTAALVGLQAARSILMDRGVESAVMSSSLAGLAEFGHPCDRYDVVALVASIPRTEAAEILNRARHAVVVAGDDSVNVTTLGAGFDDAAVFVCQHDDQPWVVVSTGDSLTPVIPVAELRHDERSALFAVALAWAQGLPGEAIRAVLADNLRSPRPHR